jgi:hypothetical protein
MGAKDKFIDAVIKLNSEGLDGDAKSNAEKDAKAEAQAISSAMLLLKIPPAAIVTEMTISGAPGGVKNTSLIKLVDATQAAQVLKSALVGINSGGPPSGAKKLVGWAEKYADAIKDLCTSVGIPKGTIIENPAPATITIPNTPFPIADLTGALAKFQTDYAKVKKGDTTDPSAIASISGWASQVASAISAFMVTLTVPPGVGFITISQPVPPGPPIAGIPNPAPLPLADS